MGAVSHLPEAAGSASPGTASPAGRLPDPAELVFALARELNADSVELPGFPDVVARIHRTLADESTNGKDVVRLVASEPVLAARLIQLSNSAAFRKTGREISDLKAAVSTLGFNLIRSEATAFAMREMDRQEWLAPIRPVLRDIWRTSTEVAALCYALARRVPGVQADEALAVGLFHLVGKLYLFTKARQQSINPREIADWERQLHDWHPTIARTLLDHWQIPARLAEAVEQQNTIFDADNNELSLLTRILCAAKIHVRLGRGLERDPAAESALARLHLNGRPFAELVAEAAADTEAVRSAMG